MHTLGATKTYSRPFPPWILPWKTSHVYFIPFTLWRKIDMNHYTKYSPRAFGALLSCWGPSESCITAGLGKMALRCFAARQARVLNLKNLRGLGATKNSHYNLSIPRNGRFQRASRMRIPSARILKAGFECQDFCFGVARWG